MTEPIPAAAIDPEMRRGKPRIGAVALALSSQAETRRLVRELGSGGVPVLLLKGPDLQQRLYGTPAAYVSGDVDVLIPRTAAKRARAILERAGWKFEPENGFLWEALRRGDIRAPRLPRRRPLGDPCRAHLPAWSFRRLERALWRGASVGLSGAREPAPESLFVFLAVHAAGHRFQRREWTRNVELAAAGVRDWEQVRRLARMPRDRGSSQRDASTSPGRHDPAPGWPDRSGHLVRNIRRSRSRDPAVGSRSAAGRGSRGIVRGSVGERERRASWSSSTFPCR